MKSKESPSLYEILKNATSGSSAVPETVSPRPITRIVAPAVIDEPPPPPAPEIGAPPTPPRIVVPSTPVAPAMSRAEPPPRLEPTPVAAPVKEDPTPPGERVLRLSMNNAIFAGLVVLGFLFAAYALGVRSGKHRAADELAAADEKAQEPETASVGESPAAPGKVWSIRLAEWPAKTDEQRVKGKQAALVFMRNLQDNRFTGSWYSLVQRADGMRLVLWWGKFEDKNSADAKERLASVRLLKIKNEAVYSKAAFEEIDAP